MGPPGAAPRAAPPPLRVGVASASLLRSRFSLARLVPRSPALHQLHSDAAALLRAGASAPRDVAVASRRRGGRGRDRGSRRGRKAGEADPDPSAEVCAPVTSAPPTWAEDDADAGGVAAGTTSRTRGISSLATATPLVVPPHGSVGLGGGRSQDEEESEWEWEDEKQEEEEEEDGVTTVDVASMSGGRILESYEKGSSDRDVEGAGSNRGSLRAGGPSASRAPLGWSRPPAQPRRGVLPPWRRFADEATVWVSSGSGGKGCVAFRREAHVPLGGPWGGDGGAGGDVWIRADRSASSLVEFTRRPHIRAGDGSAGRGGKMAGKRGADVELVVPIGTRVAILEEGEEGSGGEAARGAKGDAWSSDEQEEEEEEEGEDGCDWDWDGEDVEGKGESEWESAEEVEWDGEEAEGGGWDVEEDEGISPSSRSSAPVAFVASLSRHGERVLVAKGGRGGRGNASLRSSSRPAPSFAELGEPGASARLLLELSTIADAALVGMPNVGKSSLLNALAGTSARAAPFPFTTLAPNLGVVRPEAERTSSARPVAFADVPGLLRRASEGAGLGTAFLKHISRCRVLVHVVDASRDDAVDAYRAVRCELERFGGGVEDALEIIALNKVDLRRGTEVDGQGRGREAAEAALGGARREKGKEPPAAAPSARFPLVPAELQPLAADLLRAQNEACGEPFSFSQNHGAPVSASAPATARAPLSFPPTLRIVGTSALDGTRVVALAETVRIALDAMDAAEAVGGPQVPGAASALVAGGRAAAGDRPLVALRRVRRRLRRRPTDAAALTDWSLSFTSSPTRREWAVRGAALARFAAMTDFAYFEAAERFRDVMRRSGVDAELRRSGAREGDVVLVGGVELEWSSSEEGRFEAWRDARRAAGIPDRGSAKWPQPGG